MKGWVLLLILLAACAQPAVQQVATEEKVVEVVEKVVVQCWDGSSASSLNECPLKEEKILAKEVVAPEQKVVASVPIGRQLLDKAQAHAGYSYELEDSHVLVSGDKARHLFLKVIFIERKPITDVFVDLTSKKAVAYCNVEREEQILGKAFTWDVSDCKHYIDGGIEVPFEDWKPKGPLDYLADFADAEPVFVEEAVQGVTALSVPKTVQPSLHYEANGARVVLHIEQRTQVPIQIEIQGQQPISFKNVYFDNIPLYGGQEKIVDFMDYKPVSQEWLKVNEQ